MARLLARAARWSLPLALIVAALVAVGGLGGTLFADPGTAASPAGATDLDQTRTGIGSAGAAGALVPQDLPTAPVPSCAAAVPAPCGTAGTAVGRPSGCCP